MTIAFSVTPMSQNLTLTPGEVTTGKILIANPLDAEEDFHYKVEVVPYNVSADGNEIDTETETAYSQMAKWVKLSEEGGVLAPNETRNITFEITTPADIAGGSQAAAIIVSPDEEFSGSDGLAVESTLPIASVLYANVVGETRHDAKILENTLPSFTLAPTAFATAKFNNNGNVYETAEVTITVTNAITGEAILSAESEDGNTFSEVMMPGTTREVTRALDDLPVVGVVNLEQDIRYAGEESKVDTKLVICPIWFMLVVGMVVAMVIGGVTGMIVRRRRKRVVV